MYDYVLTAAISSILDYFIVTATSTKTTTVDNVTQIDTEELMAVRQPNGSTRAARRSTTAVVIDDALGTSTASHTTPWREMFVPTRNHHRAGFTVNSTGHAANTAFGGYSPLGGLDTTPITITDAVGTYLPVKAITP